MHTPPQVEKHSARLLLGLDRASSDQLVRPTVSGLLALTLFLPRAFGRDLAALVVQEPDIFNYTNIDLRENRSSQVVGMSAGENYLAEEVYSAQELEAAAQNAAKVGLLPWVRDFWEAEPRCRAIQSTSLGYLDW